MNQLSCSREELGARYQEILDQNDLLRRVESECKIIGWTNEEIRTFQLLLACRSNASLKERLAWMEGNIKNPAIPSKVMLPS